MPLGVYKVSDPLRGMRHLGISLPTDDWETAWRTVLARMVEAINALRQELDLLPIPKR